MGPVTLQPVKRIEIVLLQDAMAEVTGKLDALGVTGYSIIEDVLGRGERGLRAEIGLGVFQYQYLLIVCEEARVGPIVETVGPYLRRFGGLSLISDAQRIIG
ncbi:P-II family nitrogen regulator [Thioalkalivibrio sulfidiphilus]|uniref:P-II family nitrogen regulator n=1 Tax=Thioalkalivibrio sulfidiphilus TaxID=1033854 RepID=UPI003B324CC5